MIGDRDLDAALVRRAITLAPHAERHRAALRHRLARVFDLFFSTKERGTGLGLSLTQQIVVAHRGHIRCEDAPEGGTTFVMWFPEHLHPASERPATPAVIDDHA